MLSCILICVITGHNKVVAKVIFLHLFVILFTGGVCLSACWDTIPPGLGMPPRTRHPQEQNPPGADSSIQSMSSRYASYWNAFLFHLILLS